MYKLLLCWRYLRTRYLALVCIVSVLLGVATLIVVNSVMGGFSAKLKERLHGLLSDLSIDAVTLSGFPDPKGKMEHILRDPFLKARIKAMTPTLEVFAMLQFRYRGELVTRPVRLVGINPEGRASTGGFADHLVFQKNNPSPSFDLSQEAEEHFRRTHLPPRLTMQPFPVPPPPGEKPPPDPPPAVVDKPYGAIVGYAIASMRNRDVKADSEVKDTIILEPGDDIVLTTVAGERLYPVYDRFVVCDYFKSEMSEYDGNYVFVPLDHLQRLRAMEDRATSVQVKLHDYRDAKAVKERLKALFPEPAFQVTTWEDKQGPLLAAISIEKGILNVLLFLIIAVAGFGILAIFSMIVVEKTRDIGVLKALGASNGGVMKIFLGYGLLLGLVGTVLGSVLGVYFTIYINEIEQGLGWLTGQDVFDRTVYYFDKIPTYIDPLTVVLVNLGSVAIAVLFSVLPALRAALLHPVRALRYE